MIMNDKMLTTRQKQILEYIRTCVHQFGYPPSVREICKEVGLSSTSTVHGYLHRLEDLGYIRRDPAKNRTIELLDEGSWRSKKIVPLPLVGQVRAGAPIDDEATVKRYFREKDAIRLQPENDEYEPIYTRNCKILGKVVGLYRQY